MRKNSLQILAGQPLRRQVIAATCALLIPFAAIELWSESRTRQERAEEAQAQAASVAATAASYLNQYLNGLDSMASALVRHPAVMGLDQAQSDRLFAEVLKHQPLLLNVVLTDSSGHLRGSGLPATDRSVTMTYPAQVAKLDAPIVSPLVVGELSKKPTIVLAYPVHDANGVGVGGLGLSINLTELQTLFTAIPLPDGSVITLTDAKSRVLARSRDAEKFIGQVINESGALSPRDVQPEQVRAGLDGVRRYYGNALVERGSWVLSVGIPTSVAIERSAPQWRRTFAIVDVTICIALLLALWLSTLMSDGVNRVRENAQRIASGDLSPPAAGPAPSLELARLQTAFTSMAASLRDTHAVLDRQLEQERRTHEALQSLQRQVVRQERLAAVGVLVSGVAHELNNPLQAILGTAELLEHDSRLPQEALDEIAFVKTQSSRAREIIRNLSRFSSQQPGPSAPVDLRDVVAEVVQLRHRDLDVASITLEVQASSSRMVFGNFTELEQVILNFVINAQQAIESVGPTRGRILIRVTDAGKNVRVEVHDDGPGVSLDDEPKLFQPFFTTKPVGKGTGLGLSVSYGIIESFGGTIGYMGNDWGGATFFFELPIAEPSDHAAAADATESDDASPVLHRSVSRRV
jgi:C4-dicarboxylate-specific signal transduction histidine kinase